MKLFSPLIFLALNFTWTLNSAAAPTVAQAPAISKVASKKVLIIVLENEKYENALAQPYLAQIAKRGGLLTNYHGITHSSQPNYIALVAGDTFQVANDHLITLNQKSIVDLIESHGKTWKVYAEDFPGHCSLTLYSKQYNKKQNPLISFKNIQDSPKRCDNIVNADQFQRDWESNATPDFSMYVPNQLNNGHDSDVKTASRWLSKFLDPILKNQKSLDDTLIIVTFDEDYYPTEQNKVYAVLLGKEIRAGSTSKERYNHYNMLRTIEDFLGLGTLERKDATAKPILGIWKEPASKT